jgi:hypothetical protein
VGLIKGGESEGTCVVKNPGAINLLPVEMLPGEECAHPAQVEKSPLTAGFDQDNGCGGLGPGYSDKVRIINAFDADSVAYKLAKAVISDGSGDSNRDSQTRQGYSGINSIPARAKCNVFKRLAGARGRKVIYWSGQNIGHSVADTEYIPNISHFDSFTTILKALIRAYEGDLFISNN